MRMMIDPASLAFDIDGVVADTMTLFIDIAHLAFMMAYLFAAFLFIILKSGWTKPHLIPLQSRR